MRLARGRARVLLSAWSAVSLKKRGRSSGSISRGSFSSAGLTRANNTGGTATVLSLSSPSFSGGNNEFLSTTIAHTVDNFNYAYYINMLLDNNGAGQQERFYRGAVFYTLQAAPAPATASFLDVPTTSPFHRYVEALVDAGTTSGCGGGNFCPDAPVTRAQMAVFLTQLLGLSWDAHSTP